MVYALNLNDPSPEFLSKLDSNRNAAIADFHRFAKRLFQEAPPHNYFRIPPDDREDIISEIILHCIDHDCAKLRRYQPRTGSLFAGWLATVASRKISDRLKREKNRERRVVPIRSENQKHEPVAPRSNPDHLVVTKERESIFFAVFRKLGQPCRLLLRLKYRDFTNREITALLRRPPSHNKIIGTQVSDCRKKFMKFLRESGHELSDFFDTSGA